MGSFALRLRLCCSGGCLKRFQFNSRQCQRIDFLTLLPALAAGMDAAALVADAEATEAALVADAEVTGATLVADAEATEAALVAVAEATGAAAPLAFMVNWRI